MTILNEYISGLGGRAYIMAEEETKSGNRAAELEDEIQQALADLERIRTNRDTPLSAGDLEKAEREIVKATDKLASLLTGLKIQQAVDSDELKAKEKELLASLPTKMKNQGPRRVAIQTTTGEAVIVEAPYFSRSKRKKQRRKRKKKKR